MDKKYGSLLKTDIQKAKKILLTWLAIQNSPATLQLFIKYL